LICKNLLVYPLYKIKGKESEYQQHKEFVDKNIEVVQKFNCVDDIIVLGKEVNTWSEMITDLLFSIRELVKNNNILFSEADTIFVKDFSEIFSLEKFMMFSKCEEDSNIDASLTKDFYLNGGMVYYPHNMDTKMWNHIDNIDQYDSIKMTGNLYEVIMNRMYYSQFDTMEDGLNYLKKFGISKYNWCIRSSPNIKKLKHIHFLNMSHYTSDESKFSGFWYEVFFNKIYNLIMNDHFIDSAIIDLQNYCDLI
jgi:hypothetical protein